jgi:hypothetical protein
MAEFISRAQQVKNNAIGTVGPASPPLSQANSMRRCHRAAGPSRTRKRRAHGEEYSSAFGGLRANMDLSAAVMEESTTTVAGSAIDVVRIE